MTREQALLIRRAGLEHTVVDPSDDEIKLLADAGDELFMEHVAYLLNAFMKPLDAIKPFDGGAAMRAAVKAEAYRLSRSV